MTLWQHQRPFRHFRAHDVLEGHDYRRLCELFRQIQDGSTALSYRMARTSRNYDARVVAVDERLAGLLDPLFAPAWLSSLGRLLGFPPADVIDGALHSSPAGSRDGWIHTDLCPAWFDESRPSGTVRFPDRLRCEYFTGRPLHPDARPVEYIRAAALIYFLCNDGWEAGDGGETGLYAAARHAACTTFTSVPPVNNSLLFFECSPHSYHRFLSNPGRERNSVILWLHCTVEQAKTLWGETSIAPRAHSRAAGLA